MSLAMLGIHKSFVKNEVLSNVDFSVEQGEIRALIGENGAGKTTLMNIVGGVLQADRGIIVLNGREVRFSTPRASMDAGIAFIHQELNLIDDLTVYENLFIGRELHKGPFLSANHMIRLSKEVFERLEIPLDPCTMVRDLDVSYKQIVEIVRAILMNARVLIMDEATASLTGTEIDRVFKMIRSVREQGVSVVFISHKLQEVIDICDTYTVLRDGKVISSGNVADVTAEALACDMIGHDVRAEVLKQNKNIGSEVLCVQGLSLAKKFEDVSFSLRAGEVLGFIGLHGDGRSELFQCIFGLHNGYKGRIEVSGKVIRMRGSYTAYRAGIGYVPRNRIKNGILKDMSILENGTIVTLRQLSGRIFIRKNRQRVQMKRSILDLSIKADNMYDLITSISAGDQQKIVIAKWLVAAPKIMVFDDPTQGVDVGAKEEIYDIILRLAESGMAIVILSNEAQEILRLCDRALVMYHGRIQGELLGSAMQERAIMRLATGGTVE